MLTTDLTNRNKTEEQIQNLNKKKPKTNAERQQVFRQNQKKKQQSEASNLERKKSDAERAKRYRERLKLRKRQLNQLSQDTDYSLDTNFEDLNCNQLMLETSPMEYKAQYQIMEQGSIRDKLESGEYQAMNKQGRSKVWETFALVADAEGTPIDGVVVCRICGGIYKYPDCTSNLVKHKCYRDAQNLTQKPIKADAAVELTDEPQIIEAVTETISIECSSTEQESILQKLQSGEYKLINKRGRSKVWETFALIAHADGTPIDNIVICRSCSGIYKYVDCTSNLVKHKCYIIAKNLSNQSNTLDALVDPATKAKLVESATSWTIQNCRSLNILSDCGFKKFLAEFVSIGAQYGNSVNVEKILPQPAEVSSQLSETYLEESEKVKLEIDKIRSDGYAITCAVWTDSFLRESYISTTIHYTNKGVLINRLLAINSMEMNACTGENINRKVDKQLRQFGCKLADESIVIVTERGSQLLVAFKKQFHIQCINQLLSDIVEQAFKDIPKLMKLYRQCNKLLEYLSKTSNNGDLDTTLKTSSATRWNTIYYTFSLVVENWESISEILYELSAEEELEHFEIHIVQQIANVLELIEKSLKILRGENYPTLHLVIPYIIKMKKAFTSNSEDSDLVSQLNSILAVLLDSTVEPHIGNYHKMALFLFPPTNKLLHCNTIEKSSILNECKKLMQTYWTEPKVENQVKNEVNDVFDDFLATNSYLSADATIDAEIRSYQAAKIPLQGDFNVLQWWHQNKHQYPLLFKLSCRIFCIPATSFASDRTVSKARLLMSEKRKSSFYNDDVFNEIMFLNSNSELNNES